MNLIEQLEEFSLQFDTYSKYWHQINTIIEQYKQDKVGVMTEELKALLSSVNGDYYLGKTMEEHLVSIVRKQYATQEPSNTKLIIELVEALDVLTDFASTVGGSSSFWDDVWPKHDEVIDKARVAVRRE